MIIYSLVSNNGGMKRVVESLLGLSEDFQYINDIYIIVFSKTKIQSENKKLKLLWIEWDELKDPYSLKNVEHYSNIIKESIKEKIDFIIGDYLTLYYFLSFKALIVYDIHILLRVMFESFKKYDEGLRQLDYLTKFPVYTKMDLEQFSALKFEAYFISKASYVIANSQNSIKYLFEFYKLNVEIDKIKYLPLNVEFQETLIKNSSRNDSYIFFSGRYCPMKGLHFLLNKKWTNHKLLIRGIDSRIFSNHAKNKLKKNNIHFLPWTNKDSELREERLNASAVLFSSIYEPWGLALQESLSLGCLCIAHKNFSGHEEQIIHGVNGFLIDMSSEKLVEEIESILCLPDETLNMIRENARKSTVQNRKKFQENFTNLITRIREELKS